MFPLINTKVVIVSILTSSTLYILINSTISTAVMYLLVPLRIKGICEISPSDAIHKNVYTARTSYEWRISHFCVIFSVEYREI